MYSVPAQERRHQHGIKMAGIVAHQDHVTPASSVAQRAQNAPEGPGVEHEADVANDLLRAQCDHARPCNELAHGRVQRDGILVLRPHPPAATCPVLFFQSVVSLLEEERTTGARLSIRSTPIGQSAMPGAELAIQA